LAFVDDSGTPERYGGQVVFQRRVETGVEETGSAIFLRAQADETFVVEPVDMGDVLVRCDGYGLTSLDE
jgi:hypothetical protein